MFAKIWPENGYKIIIWAGKDFQDYQVHSLCLEEIYGIPIEILFGSHHSEKWPLWRY